MKKNQLKIENSLLGSILFLVDSLSITQLRQIGAFCISSALEHIQPTLPTLCNSVQDLIIQDALGPTHQSDNFNHKREEVLMAVNLTLRAIPDTDETKLLSMAYVNLSSSIYPVRMTPSFIRHVIRSTAYIQCNAKRPYNDVIAAYLEMILNYTDPTE